MQKVIIQGCSLLGLVIILGVVSASAQLSARYRAEIPFDFSVGDNSFAAGEYIVGPMSSTVSTSGLVLRNRKTNESTLLGITHTFINGSAKGKMYFINVNGRYRLSEIITPTFKKKVRVTMTEAQLAGSATSGPRTIAVKLSH